MSTIGHNNPPSDIKDMEEDGLEFVGNVYSMSRDAHEHPIVGAGQPVPPADESKPAWSRFEAFTTCL